MVGVHSGAASCGSSKKKDLPAWWIRVSHFKVNKLNLTTVFVSCLVKPTRKSNKSTFLPVSSFTTVFGMIFCLILHFVKVATFYDWITCIKTKAEQGLAHDEVEKRGCRRQIKKSIIKPECSHTKLLRDDVNC